MTDDFADWAYESNKLENALRLLEMGLTPEEILAEAGDDALWLRPLLEAATDVAAVQAEMPLPAPEESLSRLLNYAAELRDSSRSEKESGARSRGWSILSGHWVSRFAMGAISILVVLTIIGTSLVRAAQGSLPGDPLYQVKRTVEAVQLQLTFDAHQQDILRSEFEARRRQEVRQLLEQGKQRGFVITGLIGQLSENVVIVDELIIQIMPTTEVDGQLEVGARVSVSGLVQPPDKLQAWQIRILESQVGRPNLILTATPTPTASATQIVELPPSLTPQAVSTSVLPTAAEIGQVDQVDSLLLTVTAVITPVETSTRESEPMLITPTKPSATSMPTETPVALVSTSTPLTLTDTPPAPATATTAPLPATSTATATKFATVTPTEEFPTATPPATLPLPTATPTSIPATSTSTVAPTPTATITESATQTSTPTSLLPTATPSPINTPVPPTATAMPATDTPTTTSTPIPPSPTPAETPDDGNDGDEQEIKAIIESKPESSLLGVWEIGGQVFIADGDTEFRFDKGPLEIGVCARVKYVFDGNQNIATRIRSEELKDCQDN